jgi:hypothetical protein
MTMKERLPRPLNDYEYIHYLLVARDHFLWVEPEDGIAIVEFEVFVTALSWFENLHLAIGDLLTYEWLPADGRVLTVQYDRSAVNGVLH